MYSENTCPYCKEELAKVPLKSILCKKCKNKIYVRTLPPKMKKVLIKETEIRGVEMEWLDYMINSHWFKELKKLGTKKTDAFLVYDKLKERFKASPLIADVMWGVFNNALIAAIKENNQKKQSSIKFLMDNFKERESRGKDLWAF